jgi:hypothetical protein
MHVLFPENYVYVVNKLRACMGHCDVICSFLLFDPYRRWKETKKCQPRVKSDSHAKICDLLLTVRADKTARVFNVHM